WWTPAMPPRWRRGYRGSGTTRRCGRSSEEGERRRCASASTRKPWPAPRSPPTAKSRRRRLHEKGVRAPDPAAGGIRRHGLRGHHSLHQLLPLHGGGRARLPPLARSEREELHPAGRGGLPPPVGDLRVRCSGQLRGRPRCAPLGRAEGQDLSHLRGGLLQGGEGGGPGPHQGGVLSVRFGTEVPRHPASQGSLFENRRGALSLPLATDEVEEQWKLKTRPDPAEDSSRRGSARNTPLPAGRWW